jgi:hypothetical protein
LSQRAHHRVYFIDNQMQPTKTDKLEHLLIDKREAAALSLERLYKVREPLFTGKLPRSLVSTVPGVEVGATL